MAALTKAEQTRIHILDKAREVFSRKGYFQASMEEICSHAGVSKGSVYYHFSGKQALFLAILERYSDEWLAKWQEKAAGVADPRERLLALAEHFALDLDSPLMNAATEFAGSEAANPDIRDQLIQMNASYIPVVRQIVEEGIASGTFRQEDPEFLTLSVFAYLAGVGAVCEITGRSDATAFHREAVLLFLRGLEV